jgi:hypothetical protein
MFQPLDIFSTDRDGVLIWRGTAADFVAAKKFIQRLECTSSREFLILNQHTGQRQRIKVVSEQPLLQKTAPYAEAGLPNRAPSVR